MHYVNAIRHSPEGTTESVEGQVLELLISIEMIHGMGAGASASFCVHNADDMIYFGAKVQILYNERKEPLSVVRARQKKLS